MVDRVDIQETPVAGDLHDFGLALGMILRSWLRATTNAVTDLPGGPRGYQVLSMATGGACGSQAAMAERIGVDRTVMTHLIDDLEAAGLVERRLDPADRRARLIELTPKGRSAYVELSERIRRVERAVLSGLDDESVDHLRALLHRAAVNVDEHPVSSCDVASEFHPDR